MRTKLFLDLEKEEDYKEAVRRTNCVIKNLKMADSYRVESGYILVKVNNLLIAFRFHKIDESIFYFEQMTAPDKEVKQ